MTEGNERRVMDTGMKDDVNETVEGQDKSRKKGIREDKNENKDVNGMICSGKGKEEVQKRIDQRWDDELTIVEMRFGNGTVDGVNVKELTEGNKKVVKTETFVADVVEIECIDVEEEVGKSAEADECGEEGSFMDTVVDGKIGRTV